MSWEGYQQNLCQNGHAYDVDDSYHHVGIDSSVASLCPFCKAPCTWWNLVDTTNGSFECDEFGNETEERIDGFVELKEKEPAVDHTCSCGHVHQVKPAVYYIPSLNIGHHVRANPNQQ